jgi:CheY-like chemotaxis protein
MNAGTAGLILHVDDEQSIRASMSILLSIDGYEVSSAASGTEALQFVREGLHPDVLIVDFNLGERINGAEIAEEIRRVLRYAPPIIILTGDVSHAKFPRIAEVVIWLTRKPLNPQLLLATLPSFVQLSRATRNQLSRSA